MMKIVLLLVVACSVAAYANDSVSLKQTTTSPTFVNYVTNADGTTSAVYYVGLDPVSGKPVYKYVNINTGATTYNNTAPPAPAPSPAVAPAPYVAPAVAPAPYVAPAVAPAPYVAPAVAPAPYVAPAVAPAPYVAPYVAPAPVCAGTVVTNNDGTRSCVTRTGTAANGNPIFQVTNLNTGVTSYVVQTGVSACGQPVYAVSNQYGQTTTVVG